MAKARTSPANEPKEIFSAKIICGDIDSGNGNIVALNAEQAAQYWIKNGDRISLIRRNESFAVDVILLDKFIQANEIWVAQSFLDEHEVMAWDTVLVSFINTNPLSMQAVRKKLFGKKISDEEIDAIIEDIQNNKIPDIVLSYFVATSFFYKSDVHELAYTTKATAYTGDMYRFPWLVAWKYCIGWVPGNETTMIIVPILASLWITVPKTFSKSITSPAASWECVNVLMDIEFDKQEVIRLTDKVWACLVWNQKLNLAPANDRIIKVSAPLGMEPYGRMISSIMAKNYAMWINHCLIDIPMWPTAKVANMSDAKRVARHFEEIGEYLGIKMDVEITEAKQPIWAWVWACLQAREALRILQQHPDRSPDLEEKVIFLASKILLLCDKAKDLQEAGNLAKRQLKNWEAWKKMQDIIEAQNGNPHIHSEDIQLWKFSYDVVAKKDCVVDKVDMKYLNSMVRWLWAPQEYKAWIYLYKKLWDSVKEWEVIYTMYSPSSNKLDLVRDMQQNRDFYTYKIKTNKDKVEKGVEQKKVKAKKSVETKKEEKKQKKSATIVVKQKKEKKSK